MKWLTFVRERFDPGSHFLMIFLFVAGHVTVHAVENKLDGALTELARLPPLLALFCGATAFFFKLRLYDEIKDYEVDLEFNPGRPLARGLVTHRDLHIGIVVCIVFELGLFAVASRLALPALGIAIGYSLLMYKEFFIGRLIRPHLTTYAVSHTVVTVLLSLALFSGLTGKLPWELSRAAFFFALSNWCLFNIFEFGRKTFATDEERDRVESYSKIFGRFGTVALVLSQAGLSSACVWLMQLPGAGWLVTYIAGLSGLLLAVGAYYALTNRAGPAKLYRAMSSVHIVLVYAGFLARFYGVLL
jgi:hypothetical protein